jgi:hypothetical protein
MSLWCGVVAEVVGVAVDESVVVVRCLRVWCRCRCLRSPWWCRGSESGGVSL